MYTLTVHLKIIEKYEILCSKFLKNTLQAVLFGNAYRILKLGLFNHVATRGKHQLCACAGRL